METEALDGKSRAAEPRDPRVERIAVFARVLDDSIRIPGVKRRIGLDPFLGLVPGIGDWAGAALSTGVLVEAARLGASRATLIRMAGNVALEAVAGAVPLFGDLFDAAWKANVRNVRLLERQLSDPARLERSSRALGVGLAVGLAVLSMGLAAAGLWITLRLARIAGF